MLMKTAIDLQVSDLHDTWQAVRSR